MNVVEKGTAGGNERTVFHRAADEEPSEREAFEKWLKNEPGLNYGNQPPQRSGTEYSYGPTQIAWEAWRAACAAVPAASTNQEMLEALKELYQLATHLKIFTGSHKARVESVLRKARGDSGERKP